MPVKVRCPGCKKVLNAPDRARGKVLKCPQCETRIKVPSGEGSKQSSSQRKRRPSASKSKSRREKAKRPQSSTSLLANLDLSKMEDKGVRICPRCYVEVSDPELIDCEECGADLDSGGLGLLERKRKSIKGTDPKKYYKGTISDAWQFYRNNKKLTVITCVSIVVTTTLQLGLYFLTLLCAGFPPKAIFSLTAFVCGMVPYGWIWVLSLEIMTNSLTNKKKMHKVNFDFFLSSSMGLKFWLWILVLPIPFYFISVGLFVWFNYMNLPVIGMSMVSIALSMAIILSPISAAHLTMPVQYRAWLVNHQLKIFFQKPGPLLYWFAILLMTVLPAIAGLTYVGLWHGKDVTETLHNVSENTIVVAARKYEKPGLGEPDKRMMEYKGKEEVPVDLGKLIVPYIVVISSVFWIALVSVFSMRTAGRYAFMFQKDLGLIKEAKEIAYVRHVGDGEDEKKSEVRNVYMLMGLHVLAFVAWGILKGPLFLIVPLGLVTSLLWLPVAGLWKVFEKANMSGSAALIPPMAAIYWARMAGEKDAKGLLLFIPIVQIFVGIKMCTTIAEKFRKPKGYGIALALLFPIMIYILGNDDTARFKRSKK